MNSVKTNIAQLKKGDIVFYYGGEFEVTEDARESQGHRPQSGHLTIANGPANCAVAEAVCVGGIDIEGYFKVGTPWSFQGTVGGLFAQSHEVKVAE